MSGLNSTKISEYLGNIAAQFDGIEAQIGFPKGLKYDDGTPVAYVALIQEKGAPAVGIPPRPFMQPTVTEKKGEWSALLRGLVPRVIGGQAQGVEVLDAVGLTAALDIQATIATIDSPALSPVTVLLRKWKKEGRAISGKTVGEAAAAIAAGVDPGSDNKPLNATGYLQSSVRNTVNKIGAEFTA